MNWEQIPTEVFSGTTALVLFAIYLRVRGRITTWQMIIFMLLALLVGAGIMRLTGGAPPLPPGGML